MKTDPLLLPLTELPDHIPLGIIRDQCRVPVTPDEFPDASSPGYSLIFILERTNEGFNASLGGIGKRKGRDDCYPLANAPHIADLTLHLRDICSKTVLSDQQFREWTTLATLKTDALARNEDKALLTHEHMGWLRSLHEICLACRDAVRQAMAWYQPEQPQVVRAGVQKEPENMETMAGTASLTEPVFPHKVTDA